MFNLLFLSASFTICLSICFITLVVAKKSIYSRELSSPFECGFDSLSIFRAPFSLRFFFILLMFLIFDIEIILLLPLPSIYLKANYFTWTLISLFFFSVLILGLILEWKVGTIEWA